MTENAAPSPLPSPLPPPLPPPLPQATTRPSRRIPLIWFIPLLAVAIGGWLAWKTYSKRGPEITVTFSSASGLQAGQSQLKFREIVFGTVQRLELSPDQSHVLIHIATTRDAEPLLKEGTIFWVEKPRLFAGNISGLDTLVSGSYVSMLPGPGEPQTQFAGHEDPPILVANIPGHTFNLKGSRLGSISLGSPVFFRDIEVGSVLGWDIDDNADSVSIRAFVRAPYDKFVHDKTRFWNASGVSVNFGSSGVSVQMESLKALVLGGIAFDLPQDVTDSVTAREDQVFTLYDSRRLADEASYSRKIPLTAYFNESVRGLAPGSDVTLLGMTVGSVTRVHLTYDGTIDTLVAQVQFEVDPERIVGIGKRGAATPQEGVELMAQAGWRAGLASANLLTGQEMIVLQKSPNAQPAHAIAEGGRFIIPSTNNTDFSSLTSSAGDLLKNINQIPFKQIGDNLNALLSAADKTANGQQFKQAMNDMAETLARAKTFISDLDRDTNTSTQRLPQITASLEKTLNSFNSLAVAMTNGYGDDTKFHRDVERLMAQLTDAVRSIRSLTDLLARHPEALIKGRPGEGAE